MLLLQGFAASPVAAQKIKPPPPRPRPVPRPAPSDEAVVQPENRPIETLPPVSMQAISREIGLDPSSSVPAELKPMHTPKEAPTEGRPGVAIRAIVPDGVDEQGPLSPIQSIPSPPVTATFKSDNLTLGSIPPDTMGAVGPNHVVTTTNEKVVIHNRAGVILSTVTLNAFWAVTPNGLAAPSTFDPKILYDRFNGRWILVSTANAQAPTSATLVATSQTNDPTGVWNRYSIDVDAAATAGGGRWADYPSMGHNTNWITISINRFGFGSVSGFQGPSVYVLNKTTAYAGTLSTVSVFEDSFANCLAATPAQQVTSLGCGFTMVPAITEDNTTTTHYITEDWDSQFGQLRMARVTGPQATPVLTVGYQFPQSPYSWRFNASLIAGSGGYVPQRQQNAYLPSGNRPAANDSRIQNSVFRNGSFWTTHTVMLARVQTQAGIAVGGTANPDVNTAVQWWQIDPTIVNGASGTPPIQRGIIWDQRADNCHNGAGGLRTGCGTTNQKGDFYTFPNIAVNANNDVLIGYSRFSPFTLPKAGYSYRAGGDPPNTMRDSMVYREGQGNYNIGAGSPFNIRWGDYSAAMVDPVNDIDFWTIQEYALDQREIFGPGGFAGLWSTWWALIKPTSPAPAYASSLLISEFRFRGPAGTRDEFVELFNPASVPVVVHTTDGSDGWTLVHSTSGGTLTPLASIPNGTVIPAGGYYLITNEVRATGIAPYSMSNAVTGNPTRTADSDAMWTPDIADNGGIALFRTANQANFIDVTRVDSVGFAALAADSIYKEGAGLANCAGTPSALPVQLSFVRKPAPGGFQDTNNNAADFNYISTNNGAQTHVCGAPALLGTPTPCNLDAVLPGGCTGVPAAPPAAPEKFIITPSIKSTVRRVVGPAKTVQKVTRGKNVVAQ